MSALCAIENLRQLEAQAIAWEEKLEVARRMQDDAYEACYAAISMNNYQTTVDKVHSISQFVIDNAAILGLIKMKIKEAKKQIAKAAAVDL